MINVINIIDGQIICTHNIKSKSKPEKPPKKFKLNPALLFTKKLLIVLLQR